MPNPVRGHAPGEKNFNFAGPYIPAKMNAYLTKLMMYHEIHRMKRVGHILSQISGAALIYCRTVRRCLSSSEPEVDQFMEQQSERGNKLLAYEPFVKSRLERLSFYIFINLA